MENLTLMFSFESNNSRYIFEELGFYDLVLATQVRQNCNITYVQYIISLYLI